MKIEMRELRVGDSEQVARIHQVMKERDNFNFMLSDYRVGEDFGPYIERVNAYKDEATVPEGKVVSTFFVAVIDGNIAGRLSLRHSLNDWLALVGGHIGYGVAPEFRGNGVATHMLKFGLEQLNQLGIERAFISCRPQNDHSRRTIEKCGGEFAGVVKDPTVDGAEYRTYWIPTSS